MAFMLRNPFLGEVKVLATSISISALFQVQNYYVGAAMNSSGIQAAGGLGKALADWISVGELDLSVSGALLLLDE
jgi:glycine/D-amino acid oxidase-like deaminating enzyme